MTLFTDNELLKEFKRGNSAAFSNIYNRYWDKIYVQAFKRLRDETLSQDITQDIFVSLWESRQTLEIQNLPAYLNTAVRNRVFKLIATQKVKSDFYELAEALQPQTGAADHRMITNELLDAFHTLIDEMPVQRKKIFQLRYEENVKTKVIELQLNISQKTVQNHLRTLLRDIRYLLARLFFIFILINLFNYSVGDF